MNFQLNHKVALVTGASQGIGFAIAQMLALSGCDLLITSSHEARLHEAQAKLIETTGRNVVAVVADAMDEAAPQTVIKAGLKTFSTIDILVNNVGGIGQRVVDFEKSSYTDWLDVYRLNVLSAVGFTQAVLPSMKKQKWGRVIFMSSEVAARPWTILPNYAVTKAAIACVAKSLANEVGQYNITVNSIAPGVTPTPSWEKSAVEAGMSTEAFAAQFDQSVMPDGDLGSVEDVAAQVCFLCSDAARWITGSNHRVDGGAVQAVQN